MTRKLSPQAAITIGVDSYVLPLSTATQIINLMAQAVPVRRDYSSHRNRWVMTMEPCQLSIDTVGPDEIVAPGPAKKAADRRPA